MADPKKPKDTKSKVTKKQKDGESAADQAEELSDIDLKNVSGGARKYFR